MQDLPEIYVPPSFTRRSQTDDADKPKEEENNEKDVPTISAVSRETTSLLQVCFTRRYT